MIKLKGSISIHICFFSIFLALLFLGCQPKNNKPISIRPEEPIGKLIIKHGENVYLNNKEAPDGAMVYSGDEVSTGRSSIAIVELTSGGFVELNENTDPSFYESLKCNILIRFIIGEIYAGTEKKCAEVKTPFGSGYMYSEVNIEVTAEESIFTVRKGSLTSEGKPITEGQQIRFSKSDKKTVVGRITEPSQKRLCEVVEWHEKDCLSKLRIECDEYATNSVSQIKKNIKDDCGLYGERWSSDYNYNYQWCLNSPKNLVISEKNFRENALKQCRENFEKCDEYAKRASAQKIFFNFDSVEFSKDSEEILDELTDFIMKCPNIAIKIQGYTDGTGSESYNLRLSEDRAKKIEQILVTRGVAKTRLKIEAIGEEFPLESNKTKVGRSKNRRVEFDIISK
jgi:outer membrane protein OmpA-like peptidoglycan-associated protein